MNDRARTRPTVLLFDLGGVLIENPGFDNFNLLLPQPQTTAWLKERWLRSPAVRRFETGRSSPDEFARDVMEEYQIELAPQEFLARFTSWPKPFSSEAQALVRMLRQTFRVACLSNSNSLHWDRFAPFRGEFDVALSSHLTGVVKPDEEAFLYALRACEASPDDVCYFDDSIMNVEAAQAAGLQAFEVEGITGVTERLLEEGLI